MKTPTPSAIDTAIRNAARDEANYKIEQQTSDWFSVQHKADPERCYLLDIDTKRGAAINCTCEQFERTEVCKHMRMIDDYLAIEAQEAMEAGRYEIGEAKF